MRLIPVSAIEQCQSNDTMPFLFCLGFLAAQVQSCHRRPAWSVDTRPTTATIHWDHFPWLLQKKIGREHIPNTLGSWKFLISQLQPPSLTFKIFKWKRSSSWLRYTCYTTKQYSTRQFYKLPRQIEPWTDCCRNCSREYLNWESSWNQEWLVRR